MKSTNNRGSVLMIIGIILIIAALSLLVYNIINDSAAAKKSEEALGALTEVMPEPQENSLGSTHSPTGIMPVAEINGKDYSGIIAIPAIGIELPILDGIDEEKGLASRYGGSAYLSNLILCANNSKSLFGKISKLEPGDAVVFTDIDGNLFKYTVSDIEIINEYDDDGLSKGEWDLTLFTGNWSGTKRIVVRCIYG